MHGEEAEFHVVGIVIMNLGKPADRSTRGRKGNYQVSTVLVIDIDCQDGVLHPQAAFVDC